jgi:predicted dehydrogenase
MQTRNGKARIAVIGAGWWSTYTHIPALQAHPEAEVAALCDSDPEKLRAAAQAYGIDRTYDSYEEMLREEPLDGAIVATTHATHYEIARRCLERGLHVMLEKPMTLYAPEAKELVLLSRERGRELIIGYPYHFNPHALRAREAVCSGSLGAVQFVVCTFSSHIIGLLRGDDGSGAPSSAYPVHGPGAVYSQASHSGGGEGHLQITHSAGLMFFVTGLRASRVFALMNNHGLALDLVDAMTVEFEGGALGIVGGTGNEYVHKLGLQVHCERGAIDMEMIAGSASIHGPDRTREELPPLPDDEESYPRFATAKNLVDVALGRAENGSPAQVGWRTVELLDAAYRSAARGGEAMGIESLYSGG